MRKSDTPTPTPEAHVGQPSNATSRQERESLGTFLVKRFLLIASLMVPVEMVLQNLAFTWLIPRALNILFSVQLANLSPLIPGLSLFIGGIALIVVPVVIGAMVFSRMVEHRITRIHEAHDQELARFYARRNLLITDMAHDLRTPVMSIGSLAQALADGLIHNEADQQRYLRTIAAKAEGMGRLTDILFDFTQLKSEGYELQRTHCDLPQIILREAAAAFTDVEAVGMHLVVDVPEDPVPLCADERQLGRVFANLIINAVRHSPENAIIYIGLVRRAGVAHVLIGDTGTPIQGDVEELFEPFTRGNRARGEGGSGLGLSIVKRIVDMHGYRISLIQPYASLTKAFVVTCTIDD